MSEKTSSVDAAKGRLYSIKEKQEILDFADQVNAEKGRGGQSAASKKFTISPLIISAWIRSGVSGSGHKAAPVTHAATSNSIGRRLAKLQQLYDRISRSERELATLQRQFDALKRSQTRKVRSPETLAAP